MRILQSGALLALVVLSTSVASDTNHVNQSMQAFTGLFNTPSAMVNDYGLIELGYSPYLEQSSDYQEVINLKAFFNLVPNLEVNGRLATETWHCNGYTDSNCGIRDLSFSAKYKIPFLFEDWFSVAVGGQDLGGSAVNSRAYYGVASKEVGDFRLSAGYGHSESQLNWLSGPFAGIEWQPLEWLQFIAEYDANAVNLGAKLFTPRQWLPNGWQVNLALQGYSSEVHNDNEIWLGGSIAIPLSTGTSVTRYQRRWPLSSETAQRTLAGFSVPQRPVAWQGLSTNDDIAHAATPPEATTHPLSQALIEQGFEDVAIAYNEPVLTIMVENQVFNWNAMDAIGVALGVASRHTAKTDRIRLILTRYRQPVVQVETLNRCLAPWLEGGDVPCNVTELVKVSTSYFELPDQWPSSKANSSRFVPRFIFAPLLYHNLGTEFGAFDYSAGLSSNLQMLLWQGGVVDIRHQLPVDNSDDFEEGEYFGERRIENDVDRILFHQTFRLPGRLFTRFSMGQVRGDYEGVLNETVWQNYYGRHKFGFEIGRFEHREYPDDNARQPLLGRYRYYREELDWGVDLTAGQFWNNDDGVKLEFRHWFGDTMVTLQLRKTEDYFAGVAVSVPLTPRKDMRATAVQVRGIEQWSYSVETQLVSSGANSLNFDQGINPGLYHNIDQSYFNRDRLSPAYVRANLDRALAAYRKYVVGDNK